MSMYAGKDTPEKRLEEDKAMAKMLIWLLGIAIAEVYLLVVNRYLFNFRTDEVDILEFFLYKSDAISYLFAILAVVLFFAAYRTYQKDQYAGEKLVGPATTCFIIFVTSALYMRIGSSAMTLCLVAVPVFGAWIMVYYLYQRDFFLVVTTSLAGMTGLWCLYKLSASHTSLFYAVVALAIVVVLAVTLLAKKLEGEKGKMQLFGKKRQLLPLDAKYAMIYTSAALVLVTLVLGFIMQSLAYYGFMALIVWIFVTAVYYTSKLL